MEENVSQTENKKEAQPKAEENVEKVESETPLIDNARAAAKEIREATEEMKKENAKREVIMMKESLGGRGRAGEEAKTAEEIEKEKVDAEVNAAVKRFD